MRRCSGMSLLITKFLKIFCDGVTNLNRYKWAANTLIVSYLSCQTLTIIELKYELKLRLELLSIKCDFLI
jgi:hypothetical protein